MDTKSALIKMRQTALVADPNDVRDYFMKTIANAESDKAFKESPAYREMTERNDKIRANLIRELGKSESEKELIEWLSQYFVAHYDYDYGRVFKNERETRKVSLNGQTIETPAFYGSSGSDLSPAVHVTRLGQCTTFAGEVQHILKEHGIQSKLVLQESACFNKFTGRLESIEHVFNEIPHDFGRVEKLDVTAQIMARDAKRAGADIDFGELLA